MIFRSTKGSSGSSNHSNHEGCCEPEKSERLLPKPERLSLVLKLPWTSSEPRTPKTIPGLSPSSSACLKATFKAITLVPSPTKMKERIMHSATNASPNFHDKKETARLRSQQPFFLLKEGRPEQEEEEQTQQTQQPQQRQEQQKHEQQLPEENLSPSYSNDSQPQNWSRRKPRRFSASEPIFPTSSHFLSQLASRGEEDKGTGKCKGEQEVEGECEKEVEPTNREGREQSPLSLPMAKDYPNSAGTNDKSCYNSDSDLAHAMAIIAHLERENDEYRRDVIHLKQRLVHVQEERDDLAAQLKDHWVEHSPYYSTCHPSSPLDHSNDNNTSTSPTTRERDLLEHMERLQTKNRNQKELFKTALEMKEVELNITRRERDILAKRVKEIKQARLQVLTAAGAEENQLPAPKSCPVPRSIDVATPLAGAAVVIDWSLDSVTSPDDGSPETAAVRDSSPLPQDQQENEPSEEDQPPPQQQQQDQQQQEQQQQQQQPPRQQQQQEHNEMNNHNVVEWIGQLANLQNTLKQKEQHILDLEERGRLEITMMRQVMTERIQEFEQNLQRKDAEIQQLLQQQQEQENKEELLVAPQESEMAIPQTMPREGSQDEDENSHHHDEERHAERQENTIVSDITQTDNVLSRFKMDDRFLFKLSTRSTLDPRPIDGTPSTSPGNDEEEDHQERIRRLRNRRSTVESLMRAKVERIRKQNLDASSQRTSSTATESSATSS